MRNLLSSLLISCGVLGVGAAVWTTQGSACVPARSFNPNPSDAQIQAAFAQQSLALNTAEVAGIRANVLLALQEARSHGLGNSKVDFAMVEIAQDLGRSASPSLRASIRAVLGNLLAVPVRPVVPPMAWSTYFQETTNLWNQPSFLRLMAQNQFHPVKISWEDIGRNENSCWGDRISDVGIWVREREADASSAKLALSVRRSDNFSDKVLMVPADRIKIHQQINGRTVEKTLPQRLAELGLASQSRDRNVIVSNQFAIVPVPARTMQGAWPQGVPPRAAFNFSIFPYGSTNFVITDVIEGSSDAIVGPGNHQMLYANIHGQKAPFTASRAEDRQDLLRMEKELKAKGMDVDVQRYYLIQIPLKRNASIQSSNMGTPPMEQAWGNVMMSCAESAPPMPSSVAGAVCKQEMEDKAVSRSKSADRGLDRVAIGHGEAEGGYFIGAGYQGNRAEEPIRVTVIYFVTPVGKVTKADMQTFTKAFAQWDSQAIWGGSFVTK